MSLCHYEMNLYGRNRELSERFIQSREIALYNENHLVYSSIPSIQRYTSNEAVESS